MAKRKGSQARTRVTRASLTAAAKRGAKLLDRKRPGWWKDVPIGGLRMQSPTACALGHVYSHLGNGFDEGVNQLRLSKRATITYGFNLPESTTDQNAKWSRLTEAWIEEVCLRARQAAVAEYRADRD